MRPAPKVYASYSTLKPIVHDATALYLEFPTCYENASLAILFREINSSVLSI